MTFIIKEFSVNNSSDVKELRRLKRKHCTDQYFMQSINCTKSFLSRPNRYIMLREGPFDGYIVAMDLQTSSVCGFLEWSFLSLNRRNHVDSIWLRTITSKAYGHRERYAGLGTRLVKALFTIAAQNKAVKFIVLSSSWADVFYIKMGFKLVGSTGVLIKKIRSWPTINQIRMICHLPLAAPFDADLCKHVVPFTYESDNMEKWLKDFNSLSNAIDFVKSNYSDHDKKNLLKLEPFLQRKFFLLYSKKQLKTIKKFPRSYYEQV